MDELVEGMLSICAWLSPSYGTCRVGHFLPRSCDVLAITFHISLLEVRWESMEVLQQQAQDY